MSTAIALHDSVPAERSVGGGGSVEGKSLWRDSGFKGKNVSVSVFISNGKPTDA